MTHSAPEAAVRRGALVVGVTKRLGAGFTLDMAFNVPPGITMLFGASGSGKTTLLRCIAGLTRIATSATCFSRRRSFRT
jgi:ABC-type molybdate transport system ATPase subunit